MLDPDRAVAEGLGDAEARNEDHAVAEPLDRDLLVGDALAEIAALVGPIADVDRQRSVAVELRDRRRRRAQVDLEVEQHRVGDQDLLEVVGERIDADLREELGVEAHLARQVEQAERAVLEVVEDLRATHLSVAVGIVEVEADDAVEAALDSAAGDRDADGRRHADVGANVDLLRIAALSARIVAEVEAVEQQREIAPVRVVAAVHVAAQAVRVVADREVDAEAHRPIRPDLQLDHRHGRDRDVDDDLLEFLQHHLDGGHAVDDEIDVDAEQDAEKRGRVAEDGKREADRRAVGRLAVGRIEERAQRVLAQRVRVAPQQATDRVARARDRIRDAVAERAEDAVLHLLVEPLLGDVAVDAPASVLARLASAQGKVEPAGRAVRRAAEHEVAEADLRLRADLRDDTDELGQLGHRLDELDRSLVHAAQGGDEIEQRVVAPRQVRQQRQGGRHDVEDRLDLLHQVVDGVEDRRERIAHEPAEVEVDVEDRDVGGLVVDVVRREGDPTGIVVRHPVLVQRLGAEVVLEHEVPAQGRELRVRALAEIRLDAEHDVEIGTDLGGEERIDRRILEPADRLADADDLLAVSIRVRDEVHAGLGPQAAQRTCPGRERELEEAQLAAQLGVLREAQLDVDQKLGVAIGRGRWIVRAHARIGVDVEALAQPEAEARVELPRHAHLELGAFVHAEAEAGQAQIEGEVDVRLLVGLVDPANVERELDLAQVERQRRALVAGGARVVDRDLGEPGVALAAVPAPDLTVLLAGGQPERVVQLREDLAEPVLDVALDGLQLRDDRIEEVVRLAQIVADQRQVLVEEVAAQDLVEALEEHDQPLDERLRRLEERVDVVDVVLERGREIRRAVFDDRRLGVVDLADRDR